MSHRPELLIPAGSPQVFKIAVAYGADAVYIGGEKFGLRAKARNFTVGEIEEAVAFAHEKGVKVYVTVNILARNDDLPELTGYLRELERIRPDALIIADPAVFEIAGQVSPHIKRHISTQAGSTNYASFNFWRKMGASRVVAARELSLDEIRQIRSHVPDDLQIEAFVHGAMCVSYSGRCLLSNYLSSRDANHGECSHPCRWKYALMEETRPGEYMPVFEDEDSTYILSSKDLCMIDHIPEMTEAGIDSFKVEGRMKSALYVATVTRAYRAAIDDYMKDPALYAKRLPLYRRQVAGCAGRPFSTGFYFGKPDESSQIYGPYNCGAEPVYLGTVSDTYDGLCVIEQKNKFSVGDTVELIKPNGQNLTAVVKSITAGDGAALESASHAGEKLTVDIGVRAEKYDILRSVPEAETKENKNGK